jgi:hypothetical protein
MARPAGTCNRVDSSACLQEVHAFCKRREETRAGSVGAQLSWLGQAKISLMTSPKEPCNDNYSAVDWHA